ncbi:MAG: Predicted Lactate-responsive regulator, IclR family [uncultured Paraburkholderia sp.]|nr:MAG: Predicted Lactate-responsive regulator, IclR family [uncultured Paraburkholderia sp.]CAH2924507.1 MAG: Predicted Lactate-responsive regulator, IclR family [uncultured Paraburkholderia sp.]CAH2927453.1 MAG: Predicted Lactate-responsive regulator, IclR family [uncultured Paraburkholderia sp.]
MRSLFSRYEIQSIFRCLTRQLIPLMSDTNPDPKTSIQVIERMMRLLDALAAQATRSA